MPVSHQVKLSMKGGQIAVNNVPTVNQVPIPKAREILLARQDEKGAYRQITEELFEGEELMVEDSKFVAYAVKADSFD